MNYTEKYMLYITGCAAKGAKPDIPSEKLDYEYMFSLSKEQQIENLVYVSLERINADVPPELMRRFRQCFEKAIVREAKQTLELENICAAFSEAKIKHIPLKGSVIKYMYASPDLRQSGDIDILVGAADTKEIAAVMAGAGYEMTSETEKDISFFKGRLHVEVHRHLLSDDNNRRSFFEDVWKTAKPANEYTYELQPEMLYAYMLTHLAVHLKHGGAGIKLVTDFYVFNKPLDVLILNSYLREIQLDALNNIVQRLMDYWFGMKQTAEDPVLFVSEYMLKNGVYGKLETNMQIGLSDIGRFGKLISLLKMVFLPYSEMKYMYPILRKLPFLLPACHLHRLLKKLIFERHRISAIMRGSAGSADAHTLSEFKKIL